MIEVGDREYLLFFFRSVEFFVYLALLFLFGSASAVAVLVDGFCHLGCVLNGGKMPPSFTAACYSFRTQDPVNLIPFKTIQDYVD